jgi:DNA modification methylase
MPVQRRVRNRLNELSAKDWLKFQKSWFLHNPPPREPGVLRHPAKFPESLAAEFITFFTRPGAWVFDPMVGTGSTVVAALPAGRNAVGVELHPVYADIARQRVEGVRATLGATAPQGVILQADAGALEEFALPTFDYLLSSPPYWDMLHARGAETQRRRRSSPDLDLVYSDHPDDLGNIPDYGRFLDRLTDIYAKLASHLAPGAYLTVIVKNVKKGGRIYPLAWDLARRLSDVYTLKDEKIWCQDNIRLAPYGFGNAWVSNTFHHYCLQFRHEP